MVFGLSSRSEAARGVADFQFPHPNLLPRGEGINCLLSLWERIKVRAV
jgi:hypothetical protein